MPNYLRGEKRDQLRVVRLHSAQSQIFYGFNSKDLSANPNVSQADVIALGHSNLENLGAGALYFLRAQSPKPGRAVKIINPNPGVDQKGSVSTFYGAGNASTAMANRWKLRSRPRGVTLSQTARYVTAIATLSNGVKYCWPMNRADFNTYGTALGLESPRQITNDAERGRLVSGASYPRPGTASINLEGGRQFSTFYSTDSENSARAADFSIQSVEFLD